MTNDTYQIRTLRILRRRALYGIYRNGELVEGGFYSKADAEAHVAMMELQSNNNAQEGI